MRILAYNVAHDASVCVLNDGVVEFFCKEERLSLKKHDKYPWKSLALFEKINNSPIDLALYITPTNLPNLIEDLFSDYVRKMFNCSHINISELTHHKFHAALAYTNSQFNEALCFVADRTGAIYYDDPNNRVREGETIFRCKDDHIVDIYKNLMIEYSDKEFNFSYQFSNLCRHLNLTFPDCDLHFQKGHNITRVYEAATTAIGEDVLENGKTMGLASYGKELDIDLFVDDKPNDKILSYRDGKSIVNTFYPTYFFSEEAYQEYADLAKTVQIQTQEQCLKIIKKYVEKTGIKNVCICGGFGLNIVANSYYQKMLPDVNFYFEPNSDDTGISIGGAMLYYSEYTAKKCQPLTNTFYHFYNDIKIDADKKTDISKIVDLLLNENAVGIFEGAPEAGPRALGHRSILFNPNVENCKDKINSIKQREWYRPFAAIILEEYFEDYFETNGLSSSPHMTQSFVCKQITKDVANGIVHVDDTCRVQTINKNDGTLYKILTQFYEATGIPILLNTSLNLAGQPLIFNKKEALNMLNMSELQYLYIVDDEVLVSV